MVRISFGHPGTLRIYARTFPDALERAIKNTPALVDVVISRTVISSDAQKGLGFVPDYQALTAWDEAEKKRRGV